MENRRITVSRDLFRSPLIPMAAVLSTLGSLCGLGSVVTLLFPDAVSALVQDLYLSGITDRSALSTWRFIHICVTVVCFVWSLLMSGCLWAMALGKAGQGLLAVSTAGEWTLHAVHASGILTLVYLLYRLVRYVIACLAINEWAYLLYAMLVSEALMIFQAAMLFVLIRRFLNSLSDTAASLALAVTGNTAGSGVIRAMTPIGFLLLGVAELLIGADRFFTVTIVQAYAGDYYKLLMAEHPLLLLSGGMFGLCALTNLLLGGYLFHRKHRLERLFFQAHRLKQ